MDSPDKKPGNGRMPDGGEDRTNPDEKHHQPDARNVTEIRYPCQQRVRRDDTVWEAGLSGRCKR